jgi:glutathione S-transferase
MMRLSVFKWVPELVQGYQRDLRVRWALLEAGLPFETQQFSMREIKSSNYRKHQPFGQIPYLEDGGQTLFETGAILTYIAEKSKKNLWGAHGKVQCLNWVFAALNTIESYTIGLVETDMFFPNEDWSKAKRPITVGIIQTKFKDLNTHLDSREFLLDEFSIADILMADVLRVMDDFDQLESHPALQRYLERCLSREGFKKSYEDQMAIYRENEPQA